MEEPASLPVDWTEEIGRCPVQAPTTCEDTWHHSGWAARRHLVYSRMRTAQLPTHRLNRFATCGAHAVVEYNAEDRDYRIRADYCHDRHCLRCATARGTRIAAKLAQLCAHHRVRFLTLTIRSDTLPLADQLRRLVASFRELRRSKLWKENVDAGCLFVECTFNVRTTTWHPHLHCLIVGKPVPQRDLADAWHRVTGDSYIVDIRLAQDQRQVVAYVCRYTTKTSPPIIWINPDRAVEYILATKGLRLAQPFGTWHGADLEPEDKPDPAAWERVDRLDTLMRNARNGCDSSSRVLWALARRYHRTDDPALARYLYPEQGAPAP